MLAVDNVSLNRADMHFCSRSGRMLYININNILTVMKYGIFVKRQITGKYLFKKSAKNCSSGTTVLFALKSIFISKVSLCCAFLGKATECFGKEYSQDAPEKAIYFIDRWELLNLVQFNAAKQYNAVEC